MIHQKMREALASANDTIGDLRMVECALRTLADESAPVDDETRQAVLERAVTTLQRAASDLEDALDLVADHLGGAIATRDPAPAEASAAPGASTPATRNPARAETPAAARTDRPGDAAAPRDARPAETSAAARADRPGDAAAPRDARPAGDPDYDGSSNNA